MRNNNEDVNFSVLLYANLGALTTGILAGFSWFTLMSPCHPVGEELCAGRGWEM